MSWQDRLQPASFRGVSFLYESHTISGGRRVAVHEYPFADDPDPEDLGLKAHEFSFNAYVIGDDYDIAAAKLQKAFDTKGPGELVLPLSGEQNAQLLTWQRTESTAKGGMARFTLKFVQAGKLRFPIQETNVKAALLNTREVLLESVQTNFLDDLQQWLDERTSAAFEIAQQLAMVGSIFNRVQNLTQSTDNDMLVAIQAGIAAELPELPDAWSSDVASTDNLSETVDQTIEQQAVLFGLIETSIEPPTLLLATAQVQAVESTVRISNQAFNSYQDAQHIQQQLNGMITQLVEYQPLRMQYDDQQLGKWSDLRVQIAESIKQQLLILPKIKHIALSEELPAQVIAYRLHQDARQSETLIKQNGINHPAFCSGTLEYLK